MPRLVDEERGAQRARPELAERPKARASAVVVVNVSEDERRRRGGGDAGGARIGAAACSRGCLAAGDFPAHRHNDDALPEAEAGRAGAGDAGPGPGQTADIRCAWFNCDEATGHLEVRRRSFEAVERELRVGLRVHDRAGARGRAARRSSAPTGAGGRGSGSGDERGQPVLGDVPRRGSAMTLDASIASARMFA